MLVLTIEAPTHPVYGGITDNVPRLDYTDSSCPALLLEPQRTNLVTQSEYLGSALWVKPNVTIDSNNTTSPDGEQNAVEVTTTNASHALYFESSVSASTQYTFSFYVKRGSMTALSYRVWNTTNGGDIVAPTSYYSETSSSEWVRVSLTFTTPSGCVLARVYPLANSGVTGTAYLWGAQLEAGSYATSYIPTYGSSVTRIGDTCTKGAASSVIGQNEGVIFAEVDFKGGSSTDTHRFTISDSGSTNWIFVSIEGGGNLRYYIRTGGNTYIDGNVGSKFVAGNTYKIALRYKSGDTAVFINGLEIGSGNTTAFPSPTSPFSRCSITGSSNNATPVQFTQSGVKQTLLFPTSLTNEELAALTTI